MTRWIWCVHVCDTGIRTYAHIHTHVRRKWHVCAHSQISWSCLRWHVKCGIWAEFTCFTLTGRPETLLMHKQRSADFFWMSKGQLDTFRLWLWLIVTSALPFRDKPALAQALNVLLWYCCSARDCLWTSPWLLIQCWPPPWPAVTAWAVGTAAWTMRAKTSLSSRPRPRSSASPDIQPRYRIRLALCLW